ncbi:hypothetical protein AB0D08_10415 [Kitasatospora sp. NPDC048540]|uniref:hypothetical protein n=1 Tax=unclassified Kitasatospora TaxID=2633591 RepID=UPI000B05898A|nr:hypothetical protein [Kitasatospora sp. MBT63]
MHPVTPAAVPSPAGRPAARAVRAVSAALLIALAGPDGETPPVPGNTHVSSWNKGLN